MTTGASVTENLEAVAALTEKFKELKRGGSVIEGGWGEQLQQRGAPKERGSLSDPTADFKRAVTLNLEVPLANIVPRSPEQKESGAARFTQLRVSRVAEERESQNLSRCPSGITTPTAQFGDSGTAGQLTGGRLSGGPPTPKKADDWPSLNGWTKE